MYKLVYLTLRGRGEPVRWVLKAAGQLYYEEVFDIFTEWPAKKPEFSYGKVPVLEVDGTQLHQTTVICRYLGERHDLASGDLWASTRQMEIVEAIHDLGNYMGSAFMARLKKSADRQALMVGLARANFPIVLDNTEKAITEDGWILSPTMTWADVFVASYMDVYEDYFPGVVSTYPRCHELRARVRAIPAIAKWIKDRPPYHAFESPEGMV